MGLFSRKPAAPPSPPQPIEPVPLSAVGLPSVDELAAFLLSVGGLPADEIARLRQLHPTQAPPNPDHKVWVGDPANPWTLAVLSAEQYLWDAMNSLIVNRARLPMERAQALYEKDGVEGLAGVLIRRDLASLSDQEMFNEVVYDIARNPNHPLGALVFGYVREYWIVGVGPKEQEG